MQNNILLSLLYITLTIYHYFTAIQLQFNTINTKTCIIHYNKRLHIIYIYAHSLSLLILKDTAYCTKQKSKTLPVFGKCLGLYINWKLRNQYPGFWYSLPLVIPLVNVVEIGLRAYSGLKYCPKSGCVDNR